MRLNKIVKNILIGAAVFSLYAPEVVCATELNDAVSNLEGAVSSNSLSMEGKVIEEKAVKAVDILEELLNLSYEEKQSELKEKCMSEGYDYSMSLAAFTEYGNPFDECDYMQILAAYCMTVGQDTSSTILDFSFLDVTYEVQTVNEPVAYKTYTYEEVEDGLYEKGHVYYITEDQTIDTYEEVEDGLYKKTGKENIVLDTEDINYLVPTFNPVSAESILNFYGLDIEDDIVSKELNERVYKLKTAGLTNNILQQNIFIQLAKGESVLDEDALTQLNTALSSTTGNTHTLIQTAASLVGRVPYLWGGKAKMPGYDNSWWTFNEAGKQLGLDCSGYVQWTYLTAGFPSEVYENLYSTSSMLGHYEQVSYDELQIGDIGLLNHGESVNHTGIYIGGGYFIHCSGSADTVTVSSVDSVNFTIFKHVCDLESYSITPTEVVYSATTVSESDAYVTAQLIENEAGNQGVNGKVAVAEVVRNRVLSEKFPSTVLEVIYQDGQFDNVERIASITPSEEDIEIAREVLSGTLRILNDTEYLYFNNPSLVSSDKLNGLSDPLVINEHTFYKSAN